MWSILVRLPFFVLGVFMNKNFYIRKVAVLGAGVMGADSSASDQCQCRDYIV